MEKLVLETFLPDQDEVTMKVGKRNESSCYLKVVFTGANDHSGTTVTLFLDPERRTLVPGCL